MENKTSAQTGIIPDSAKLEAMGRMAGVIAHDFNNMLGAIEGYASLILRGRTDEDPIKPDLEEIKKAVAKAAGFTKQLLLFSRTRDVSKAPVRPNELAEKLPCPSGNNITLSLTLQPEAPLIMADAGQLTQLLTNLLSNAGDAMPGGGEIKVSTSAVTLGDQAVHAPDMAAAGNEFVVISVSDKGTGMPPEVIERLFEPFFTTKEKGKGTGLGLSTAYGIARRHNGWLQVRTGPGGSEFSVFLPSGAPSTAI